MIGIKSFRVMAAALVVGLAVQGCAITRGQQDVGEYADDSAITAQVKSKYAVDSVVAASAISVETLDGTVVLSGFATTQEEKAQAERLAKNTKGVKAVRNAIVVKPPQR